MVNYLPDRREQNLEIRLRGWIDKLFDLSGRNNLLYFNDPDQKRSFTLHAGDMAQLSRLVAGETLRLTDLVAAERLASALKRLRKINEKAIENYEERSIETLTLAVGILTWTEDEENEKQRSPRAPILLADIQMTKIKGRNDYEITMVSESFRLNQALRYKLRRDFSVEISFGSQLDGPKTGNQRLESFRTSHVPDASEFIGDTTADSEDDTGDLLSSPQELIKKLLVPQVGNIPGALVDADHVLISNFSSSRLAMIQDLEASQSDLLTNTFVMAMADDPEAKSRLREQPYGTDPTEPNRIAPADEFLILDADASQNEVINAILSGKSFAFDGPPGTGKSQTIANAIAALIARGKRVLFVAEKRAAIDAVLSRLDQNGLGDLIMDFHASSQRKKEFIRKLRETNEVARQALSTVVSPSTDELVRARQHLVERAEALHERRSELGISLHELLKIAHRTPGSFLPEKVSFSQKTLRAMSHERVFEVKDKLRVYVDYGGLREGDGARLWRSCVIDTQENLDKFSDFLADFGDQEIGEIRNALTKFATEIHIPTATPITCIDAYTVVSRLCSFADVYSWEILQTDLREIQKSLSSSSSKLGLLALRIRPKSHQKLVEVRKRLGRRVKLREVITLVSTGAELQRQWDELAKGVLIPDKEPAHLDLANEAISRYQNACISFAAIPELVDAVENLRDDAGQMITNLRRELLVASGLLTIREIERWLHDAGLDKAMSQLIAECDHHEQIGERFEEAWAHAQIQIIMNKDPRLVSTDSSRTRNFNTRFIDADIQHLKHTPERIRRIWAGRFEEVAKTHADEHATLIQTFHQGRNLPSVRQLFDRTKHVVCTLKPCWVTSPLSVSTLRPPSQWFDVVIFDEASQIKPVHAITSIKAARQVVVAGDEEQLPPTDFFADGGDDGENDGTDEGDGSIRFNLTEIRSLLGATKAIVTQPRQLLWHYRSRDERLIGFSNNRIYKSLITFPHSDALSPISHILVDEFPDNVTTGATNKAEVRRVIDLIKNHASSNSGESLGVIALGKPHADAIIDALEKERESDLELTTFLDSMESEPFFVKNLERVQGDERDAIILSIGYGRREDGSLSYTFGPVNREDGYRRLNVATTRAKSQMTVVSSFKGEEMIESKCQGGTSFLRDYLIYARSGGLLLGRVDNATIPLNPFEKSIQRALEAEGLELVPQHGVGRFRIDFAVRHPVNPAKFALAIECDGASYHNYPTARDRDRLRQQILESRGWKFHRIWSTDWFRNPENEIQKTLESYRVAIRD